MITKALGLIETIGLIAAVEAADAAVKSANVKLIGYELAKGDGMVTVKIEGDVGAVSSAIAAAYAAASKVSAVCSTQVIPRPAAEIKKIIFTPETVGMEPIKVKKQPHPAPAENAPWEAEETATVRIVTDSDESAETKESEAAAISADTPLETDEAAIVHAAARSVKKTRKSGGVKKNTRRG